MRPPPEPDGGSEAAHPTARGRIARAESTPRCGASTPAWQARAPPVHSGGLGHRKPAARRPGAAPVTIGIDTGGTFTDLVLERDGEVLVAKVPSTPEDPARAVADGLARLAEAAGGKTGAEHVVHGTTVALNALLTSRTARVALVTNEGFRDLIEIGRQDRPEIYALHPEKAAPLVPRSRRFELPQRSWPSHPERDGLRRRTRTDAGGARTLYRAPAREPCGVRRRVPAALLGRPVDRGARRGTRWSRWACP